MNGLFHGVEQTLVGVLVVSCRKYNVFFCTMQYKELNFFKKVMAGWRFWEFLGVFGTFGSVGEFGESLKSTYGKLINFSLIFCVSGIYP